MDEDVYQENQDVLPDEQQDIINRDEATQEAWDGVSEPSPASFSDYDEYVRAVVDWKVKQASPGPLPTGDPQTVVGHAVAEGVAFALQRDRQEQAQAQQQAAQQLTPFVDDPKKGERAHWSKLSMDAGKEAIKAKEAGDTQKYHDWRQRQRQYESEIERIGPTPEQEFVEAVEDYKLEQGMKLVTNPDHANNPIWKHPRWQADSPTAVMDANARARTTLRLPLETSKYGNLLPCEPQNMATVELDPDQIARVKDWVDGLSPKQKEDPDAVLRKYWEGVHRFGYDPHVKPVMEKKATRKAEGEETDPDRMTWAEFVKWREATEAKKRGRPRQGFTLPRTRQRNG